MIQLLKLLFTYRYYDNICLAEIQLYFFLIYFEILDLQKGCEDSMESYCIPLTQFPPLVTPYITML